VEVFGSECILKKLNNLNISPTELKMKLLKAVKKYKIFNILKEL